MTLGTYQVRSAYMLKPRRGINKYTPEDFTERGKRMVGTSRMAVLNDYVDDVDEVEESEPEPEQVALPRKVKKIANRRGGRSQKAGATQKGQAREIVLGEVHFVNSLRPLVKIVNFVARTTPCSRRFIYAMLLTLILSLATMAASSSSSQPDKVLSLILCAKWLDKVVTIVSRGGTRYYKCVRKNVNARLP